MLRGIFPYVRRRISELRRDCRGFVLVSTLAIFLFLFLLCAFVYAVGETIHQRIKMQNACDAAAYSAAVVQADGLSRMATVNRAMAWSYVQMTSRQMDYITYRWLKLTCKRFNEDRANAKAYAAQLTLCIDRELGPYAIIEALISAVIDLIFEFDCSTGSGHSQEVEDGRPWWCGLKYGTAEEIDFNPRKLNESISLSSVTQEVKDSIAEQVIQIATKENVEAFLAKLSFIDKGDQEANAGNASSWGYYLGKWIDYDKKNIYRMNRALNRINRQMTISMRMTAEGVLKATLKDNRLAPEEVLKDYYISIHIPEARDPYEMAEESGQPRPSFFSPLHNTEADEMLFLNMQSAENCAGSLHTHFPTLPVGKLACGLDQWFIRGTGQYNMPTWDEKEPCYEPLKGEQETYRNGKSGWVNEELRLLGTRRDEGTPGIQRVYKDANLNETNAGFLSAGENGAAYPVSRGNHLIDLTSLLNWGLDQVKSMFAGSGSGETEESDADEERSIDDLIKDYEQRIDGCSDRIAAWERENQELMQKTPPDQEKIAENNQNIAAEKAKKESYQKELDELRGKIGSIGDPGIGMIQPGKGDADNSSTDFKEKVADFADDFITSLVGGLAGRYVDISPSCGNAPRDTAKLKNFMCESVTSTAALYAEYRWASSKWYCCTTWKAYLYSLIFEWGSKQIYCDFYKHTFWDPPIGSKLKARGWGHFAFFPKWFCGSGPNYPADTLVPSFLGDRILSVLPPLTPESIYGARHGYMSTPLDLKGMWTPLKCLSGSSYISRDDYESCVAFPDGPFTFMEGRSSYAGYIQGHARIYGDDREIFDNRYVGARCKPWVLNERFFAGEGTIVVGAAMKHTNPLVQLFNFWNTRAGKTGGRESYTAGAETQENAQGTVLAAFNIPKDNYMWTMSAARAGVRHRRRNGAFDQERQYQITYDPTSDVENLYYAGGPYVLQNNSWVSPDVWGREHNENPQALSRIPVLSSTDAAVWNGCPCVFSGDGTRNESRFRNLWNLCETDWDATFLPLRYSGRKAALYLSREPKDVEQESIPFQEQSYSVRRELLEVQQRNEISIGNGRNWVWNSLAADPLAFSLANPFLRGGWKPGNMNYFSAENLFYSWVPEEIRTGISMLKGLNLNSKIPTGKKEEAIGLFLILKDRIL